MKILSVSWNPDSDVTKVTFTKEFLDSHRVAHIDVLNDIIVLLHEEYFSLMEDKNHVIDRIRTL
jgi:hypothetical protein